MPDIDHLWGNDINASGSGDLGVTDGQALGIQRIVRRLMTRGFSPASVGVPAIQPEYIWHRNYGASIPQRIGGRADVNLLTSIIGGQILLEANWVAPNPPPQVTLTPFQGGGMTVLIIYTVAATGLQQRLSFNVNQ